MSTAVVMTTHRLRPEVLRRFRRLVRAGGPEATFLLVDGDAVGTPSPASRPE